MTETEIIELLNRNGFSTIAVTGYDDALKYYTPTSHEDLKTRVMGPAILFYFTNCNPETRVGHVAHIGVNREALLNYITTVKLIA